MSRYDVHYEVLDGHSAQVGAFEADDATLIFDTDSTSSSSATSAFQKLINGIKSRQRKERACSTVLCVGLSLLVIFVLGSLMIASNLKFKHKRGGDDDNNLNFANFDLSGKRALVRRMTREAWAAYKQYAWGHDALRPVAMAPYDEWAGAGASIVGAMSTLYVMGLKGEYLEGREWIAEKLNFSKIDGETDVHATIVQYIGGLLSAYALTGDLVFREKAVEIAAALDVAFNSTTGLPYQYFNPAKGTAYHSKVALSETGHLQPELVYLANIGKNRRLNDRLAKIEAFLRRVTKPRGLLLSTVDVDSGNWTSNSSSLSGESNQFTYNLLRAYLQSGAKAQNLNNNATSYTSDTLSPQELFTLYTQRLLANGLISHSTGGHYTFTGDLDLSSSGSLHSSNQMLTSACNLGAMFALAGHSQVAGPARAVTNAQFWQLGINLTKTCYEATAATKTHLPPAYFIFEEKWGKDVERPPSILVYKTSADVSTLAESYFFLWRLSGDERYREYAWELVQSIWRYNRVAASGGYAAIVNVDGLGNNNNGSKVAAFVEDDIQYPQLLSATFKYLYLIFAEQGSSTGPPASLPLSKWVFSKGGHPLPICGQSPAYRAEHCTTVEFNL